MTRPPGAVNVVMATVSLLVASLSIPTVLSAQATAATASARVDSATHRKRFVQVNGASVELLEWGGTGQLMLFLPGFGNSAHVFDDLAPAFTGQFRVAALTPRGVPPSSAPDAGYTIAQLAEDVRSIVNALGARTVILVGHSIAGAVITEFGVTHPNRLAAAIYLDASFDFGAAFRQSRRVGRPAPRDTTSAAYRAWEARYSDSLLSRSILNAIHVESGMWEIDSADASRRLRLLQPLADEVRSREHAPWRVRAPLLAVCAVGSMDRGFGWLTSDSARWKEARAFADRAIREKQKDCAQVANRAPHARVINLDSGHYVFMDARKATLRAMRTFLAELRQRRQ